MTAVTRSAAKLLTLTIVAALLASHLSSMGAARAQSAACDGTFASTGLPEPIPDPGVSTTGIDVVDVAEVQDIDVAVSIEHPFVSDLTLELVAPTGERVLLAQGVGTWGDGFTGTTFDDQAPSSVVSNVAPFTGSVQPEQRLSLVEGLGATGTWQLSVTDRHGGYAGEITAFALDFDCRDIDAPTGANVSVARFQRSRSVNLRWAAGADGSSGVSTRDVNYFEAPHRSGFGPLVEWRNATTSTSGRLSGRQGTTYCFSERIRDNAGNVSAFSAQRCTAVPIDDSAIRRSRYWKRVSGTGYYGGSRLLTRRRGARINFAIEGSQVALLVATCPDCGTIKVFRGTDLLGRRSLVSKRLRKRRLIAFRRFGGNETGKLRIVVVSRRKTVAIDGIAVLRDPPAGLPAIYDRLEDAGALPLPPLSLGSPVGAEDAVGPIVVVTADSDQADGTTTSVAALLADPGPDGLISLNEAILATNNETTPHTVHFDDALDGATIDITSPPTAIPPLKGPGLFVDGDLDGDGAPNVTIANATGGPLIGFNVSSDDNRLHALEFKDFTVPVSIGPEGGQTDASFARNILSGLSIQGSHTGVLVVGGQGGSSTGNEIVDTRIVGNKSVTSAGGLNLSLSNSVGDSLERTTVAGNIVQVDPAGASAEGGFGIGLNSGGSGTSRGDLVSDALLAHNLIEGTPEGAIFIGASSPGNGSGTEPSILENVSVIGNVVDVEPLTAAGGIPTGGMLLHVGDDFDPSVGGISRRLEVERNRVSGFGAGGIRVVAACCAATGGRMEDITIEGNIVEGVLLDDPFARPMGVALVGSGGSPIGTAAPVDNGILGAEIRGNSISIETQGDRTDAEISSAGILILGAEGAGPDNFVRDVVVADNLIDSELIGVDVIGGWHDAHDNEVFDIDVAFNSIVQVPVLSRTLVPGVEGVSLIGGTGIVFPFAGAWQTSGNVVRCVNLTNNLVLDQLGVRSVLANVDGAGGGDAFDNSASTAGC